MFKVYVDCDSPSIKESEDINDKLSAMIQPLVDAGFIPVKGDTLEITILDANHNDDYRQYEIIKRTIQLDEKYISFEIENITGN